MSPQKRMVCIGILTGFLCGPGCEQFHPSGWSLLSPAAGFEQEEKYRHQFVTEGDSQAVRWLLINRIASGMERTEVNQVLGREGDRQFDDGWIKNNGGTFRQSDKVYKWGPDSEGQSYYLVFRDDHLVNFNPEDYE